MILGLGNDIIEIERIKASIERHGSHILNRLFTPLEQEYCMKHKEPAVHFAGRFAAKEAFVKALGVGFGENISWLDIEIVNNERGKPLIKVSPSLQLLMGPSQVFLTISHCRGYATAVVIWSGLEHAQ